MSERRTVFEKHQDRHRAVEEADKQGILADSMDVRMALIAKVKSGEMTLTEVQDELARIKRSAKKNGLPTRSQVYRDN